jgi:hypothetical protein
MGVRKNLHLRVTLVSVMSGFLVFGHECVKSPRGEIDFHIVFTPVLLFVPFDGICPKWISQSLNRAP